MAAPPLPSNFPLPSVVIVLDSSAALVPTFLLDGAAVTVFLDPFGAIAYGGGAVSGPAVIFYLPSPGTYTVENQTFTIEGTETATVGLSLTEKQLGTSLEIGYQADASDLSTLGGSTCIGWQAGLGGMGGGSNTFIGFQVGLNGAAGGDMVGVGFGALASLSGTADGNVAVGALALHTNSTGSANVGVGLQAGQLLTTGSDNVFIGESAGKGITTTSLNVFVGHLVGSASGAATQATAVGPEAGGFNAVIASNTVAVGYRAAGTSQYATSIGNGAGARATGAVAIGCDSTGVGASTTVSNQIALGTANHTLKVITPTVLGNGASTGLSALALGTGGGPASDVVAGWLPITTGLGASWIPVFQ